MNYHNITKDDMNNGSGLRVVLWLSGCSHRCNGCHNPQTWDSKSGILFDDEAKQELFKELEKDHLDGITLSGGDPLNCANIEDVSSLIKDIKELFPSKTIWLYTGYTIDEIYNNIKCTNNICISDIMENIDVLVDGKFIEDLKDVNYHWAGSTNQRVIDVQKSTKDNIILYKE